MPRCGLYVVAVVPVDPALGWHRNILLVRTGIEVNLAEPVCLLGSEPLGAVVVRLEFGHRHLYLIPLHLGLFPAQPKRQA